VAKTGASLLELMPEEAMRVDVSAKDWRDAVRKAGEALHRGGITELEYSEEMIAAVEQLGPYIVIAPGLAIAHARPSPAVRRTGLSWVGLVEPVEFGHETNDPVRLVIGLAATDHTAHIAALSQLAGMLSEAGVESLASAASVTDVRTRISDYERTHA
jgi:PTS system ascorbate-specific IIA component